MIRRIVFTLLALVIPAIASAQITDNHPIKTITDGDIVGSVTFSNDTVYLLDGFVYVENGETLTIQPGTVIKGKPGQGSAATALIVARGGKIFANGTASQPIVFTAEADDLDDPNDIDVTGSGGRGLWGSLIVLGKATVRTATGVAQIEGIPVTETRGEYGGGATPDDNDNSGVIRYVSLRHGGSIIGANNEINGLTMGGVGRGTTIEYVEAYANLDDGFEFFGGTVNARYLATVFCDDDGFDWDFGYSGSGQYWVCLKDDSIPSSGSRGGELDYCTPGGCISSGAWPYISNATILGSGKTSSAFGGNNDVSMAFRSGTGGYIYNSIFADHRGDAASFNAGSLALLGTQLVLQSNLFWDFGGGSNPNFSDLVTSGAEVYMAANNSLSDPEIFGISRKANYGFDPRFPNYSPAASGRVNVSDPNSYIDNAVTFRGAFDPNAQNWMCGWTATSFYGVLAPCVTNACDCVTETGKPVKVFTDADMVGTIQWTKDTIIELSGFVYVENSEVLNIGPGTIIKGQPGQGSAATALVVARGGKIFANGTRECPIVFTATADNVDNPTDFDVSANGRGLWGSVIILGKATVRTATGVAQIEGIPVTETRGEYGGAGAPDDNDNSGVFRYVSLRHGGSIIGANNEINGLTMGGVGRGTKIEYVEAYQNLDDGFEFFGGTVNTRYLVTAFCDDDGFDWDFGWSGSNQYWVCLKDDSIPSSGSRAGEWDYCTPGGCIATGAWPYVSNATLIGAGKNSSAFGGSNDVALAFRSGTGAHVYNSIVTDHRGDVASFNAGSLALIGTPDLVLDSNIFFGFGGGSNPNFSDLVTAGAEVYMANHNSLADPKVRGISRIQNNGFDPRPDPAGIAASGAIAVTDPQGLIKAVPYRGAMNPNQSLAQSWLGGWTFLDCGNHLGEVSLSCCVGVSGNVDGDPLEGIDISDLSALIDYLYISFTPPVCPAEANCDGDLLGGIDISDLSALIDYLYISFTPTAACQ